MGINRSSPSTEDGVDIGTPIVNKLEDLYSLVHFLGVQPWSLYSYWRTFITVPFENKEYVRALDVVQTILEPLVLRRTKNMKDSEGTPFPPLPNKATQSSPYQKNSSKKSTSTSPPQNARYPLSPNCLTQIYNYIFTRAKRTFTHAQATGTVMKNYTTILSMLLRLRQSCCHCSLVKLREPEASDLANAPDVLGDDVSLDDLLASFRAEDGDKEVDVVSNYGREVLQQIESARGECPICAAEPMVMEAVTIGCWHMACKTCLLQHIEVNPWGFGADEFQRQRGEEPICHTCRTPISESSIFDVIRLDENGNRKISLVRHHPTQSTKLDALIRHLRLLREQEPLTKSVVFSQFTSFLDIVEKAFKRERIQYVRLDGSTTQLQRAAVLEKFSSHQRRLVLLISLKAGGVGLNLVAASRVFMLDPWWSFAVEAQAIDRVWSA
jgi:DNA repair protein RAD5